MCHLNHLAIKTKPHSQSLNIKSPFPCLSLAFWWVELYERYWFCWIGLIRIISFGLSLLQIAMCLKILYQIFWNQANPSPRWYFRLFVFDFGPTVFVSCSELGVWRHSLVFFVWFFYDCIFEQDLFGHVPDTLEVENTNVLDFLQVHLLPHLFFTMVLLRCSQLNAVLIKVNNNLLKLH